MHSSSHWLSKVAGAAGLSGGPDLHIPAGTTIDEAWSIAAHACGLREETLAGYVAAHYGLQVADLSSAEKGAAKLLPESVVKSHHVFPLRENNSNLWVATANPMNLDADDAIAFASGRRPILEIAPPTPLHAAIGAQFHTDRMVESMLSNLQGDIEDAVRVVGAEGPADMTGEESEHSPVIKLSNLILRDAVLRGASDVHIQPGASGGVVRFRVDGVLRPYMPLAIPVLDRVVSRIKVLGALDVANRLKPQDGRATIAVADRKVDLRISTVPTRSSEKAVIRLLDPVGTGGLETVGMPPQEVARFKSLLAMREGIIVVTGPTGSGKTTSLYAALRQLATEDVNIMTVEDPIEYELSGLTQIQVEPKQGVTFASALRAVLRQDPDIVLVGEIRDGETAEIAVQASLTGHLVLATLHTNDAVGAIRRLVDLGLDRAAIADTLCGALAQRLVRQACPTCVTEVTDPLTAEELALQETHGVRPSVRAPGCPECSQTGYRGRLPVVELFQTTPDLQELIASGASSSELNAAAVAGGMRSLREVALERERAGETTLEEVQRVIGEAAPPRDRPAAPSAVAEAPDASRVSVSARMPPTSERAEQPHVLVVDDDPTNRAFARALLGKHGYQVSEAVDGLDAIGQLDAGGFDLMVLDLDMPRLSGHEVLTHARRQVATAGLPVIVFTSTVDSEAEADVMENGADDYIRKPIDARRFSARVKAVLRRAAG